MISEDFGAAWLTKAFHKAGTLPEDNRVVKIHRAQELAVKGFDAAGGAAMKMILEVRSLIATRSMQVLNITSYCE